MTVVTLAKKAHECIAEEELIELVSGRYVQERAFRVLAEVESCADCHALMLEALRAFAEQSGSATLWSTAEDAAHWLTGSLVANRYRIVRRIGSGGMGDVYEAFDTELTQRVALKTIAANFSRHETSLERLKQEVRLARRVAHPNVCRVLEFGRHRDGGGDRYFLTMELLDGELLSTALRREGSMTPQTAVEIIRQVAEGLRAIHGQNIVHRDVKSSNVLLVTEQEGADARCSRRAVLLDFGIARSLDVQALPLTTSGLVGTPDYMAPEQIRGEPVSPATDVYALGLVLFELLCGRLPRGVAQERSRLALPWRPSELPPLPAPLPPGVPPQLVAVVRWCLAPEPAARPPTMEVLLQALNQGEGGPQVGRAGARARGGRRPTHRAVASAASALVLLTAGFMALPRAEPEPTGRATGISQAAPLAASFQPPPLAAVPSSASPSAPAPSPAALVGVSAADPERGGKGSAETPRPRRDAHDAQRLRCSPPYYYDEQGIRIYRKECL